MKKTLLLFVLIAGVFAAIACDAATTIPTTGTATTDTSTTLSTLDPDSLEAAINLGGAYILLGKHAQAVPVLEAASRLRIPERAMARSTTRIVEAAGRPHDDLHGVAGPFRKPLADVRHE